VDQFYIGLDNTGNKWVLLDTVLIVDDLDIRVFILVSHIIGNGWNLF